LGSNHAHKTEQQTNANGHRTSKKEFFGHSWLIFKVKLKPLKHLFPEIDCVKITISDAKLVSFQLLKYKFI
jgi:hypothetical protein